MQSARLAALALIVLVLAACGAPVPETPGTPPVASRSEARLWTLADVEVGFSPDANLSWFEATYATDAEVERRVGTTMRIALTQAAADVMNGGRHVTLSATVREFHGLSAQEVYAAGGPVSVTLDLAARDAVTGHVLAERKDLRIEHYLNGGIVLLAEPGSQRSQITELVRAEARRWLNRCCVV